MTYDTYGKWNLYTKLSNQGPILFEFQKKKLLVYVQITERARQQQFRRYFLSKVKTCCYDPLYLPTCSVPQQYTVTHHFYFLTQQASYKAKCKCSLSKLNRKRMWKTKYLQNYYLTVILFKGTQCIVQNLMIQLSLLAFV